MRRPGSTAAIVDALGLSLVSTALTALAVGVVVLPQRLAQQPAGEGVLAVHLDAGGTLRLWNRPIRARELLESLQRPPQPLGRRPGVGQTRSEQEAVVVPAGTVLRLIPDPDVPWGIVRQAAAGLESSGLALELQLP